MSKGEPKFYNVYISGPMQDKPEFNFPLFDKAAKDAWTEIKPPKPFTHLHVTNPADNFDRDLSHGREEFLCLAMEQVEVADAIVMLEGWEESQGARLELTRALHRGIDTYEYDESTPWAEGLFALMAPEYMKARLDETRVPLVSAGKLTINAAREEIGIKPFKEDFADEYIEYKASGLVRNGERQGSYGHPSGDFDTIAKIWSAILSKHLGIEVSLPKQMVAILMQGMKLSRLARDYMHYDSELDIIGYGICWDRLEEE